MMGHLHMLCGWLVVSRALQLPRGVRPLRAKVLASSGPVEEEGSRIVGVSKVSMKAQFERALVLQRAGDLDGALEEYEAFVSAAAENDFPPDSYAEVLGNIGAIHLRRKDYDSARATFEQALEHRDLGSTRCNLAIISLSATPDEAGLRDARSHARAALKLNDSPQSAQLAQKILGDIELRLDSLLDAGPGT